MSSEKSTLRWMIELFAWISLAAILLAMPVAWLVWSSKRVDPNLYAVRNAEWAGAQIDLSAESSDTPWGRICRFRSEHLGWLPHTGVAPFHRFNLPTWRDNLVSLSAVRLSQREISPEHQLRLHKLLRIGGRFHLKTVNLANSGIDAMTLQALAECPELQTLSLENCPVTDPMLAFLAPCNHLETLDLTGTKVTGDGLAVLRRMPKLVLLNLRKTALQPTATRHLGWLGSLQELDLGGTAIGDLSCRDLAGLKSLVRLSLDGAKVGDTGVAELASLKSLVYLDLSDTAVTDAGASALASLPQLSHLKLSRTSITSRTLEALAAVPLLHNLDLRGCAGVSEKAVAALQKRHPDLHVWR